MVDATLVNPIPPISVENETVGQITTAEREEAGTAFCRVTINLKKAVDYHVAKQPSGLLVSLVKPEGQEVEGKPEEETVTRQKDEITIESIEVSEEKREIVIAANQTIEEYETLVFDDPNRLVIDFPKASSFTESKVIPVGSPVLEKVRIREYSDRVRVVLHFPGEVPHHQLYRKDETVVFSWTAAKAEEGEGEAEIAKAEGAPGEGPEEEMVQPTPQGEGEEAAPPTEARVYTGQKISLDFKDADIRNILRLIADVSGQNIIVSDAVAGTVTLKLDNIPWDQVNEKYEAKKSEEKVAELITEVVDIIYRNAKDIAVLLEGEKDLLSARGSISIDPQLNRLIIIDTVEKVAAVKEKIARYDDKTIRQVLIEARIIQSNPAYTKELGIEWGGFFSNTADGGNATYAGTGIAGADGQIVNLPASVGEGVGGGLLFSILDNDGDWSLDIALSALEEDGKVKIISSPKVLSLDKEEARIKQGVALPYLTLSEEGVTSTEFKDAVLELVVTPTIMSERIIQVNFFVSKNQQSTLTGGGGEPGIDVREAETTLMMEDGATVVIGGIYEEEDRRTVRGVPFFADIPFFGRMFKNISIDKSKTELLIFLTTTIIA
jgi:type IV pilus assembly protein PilQ